MEAHDCLKLGSKDECVMCSDKITDLNRDRSGRDWNNFLKLITRYCDIDLLELFDLPNGFKQLLMRYLDRNQQLEQLSFTIVCRECVEIGTVLESSLEELISSRNDFDNSIRELRTRLLAGVERVLEEDEMPLDEHAAAANTWRQQMIENCVPSMENLLMFLDSAPAANVPGSSAPLDNARDNNPPVASTSASGQSSVASGTVGSLATDQDEMVHPVLLDIKLSPTTPPVETMPEFPVPDDVSMDSQQLEMDGDNDDRQSNASSSGSLVAAMNAQEADQSRDFVPASPSTVSHTSQGSPQEIEATPPEDVPASTPLGLSISFWEPSQSLVVRSLRHRQQPARFSFPKNFLGRKNPRANPGKKNSGTGPFRGPKCPICKTSFRRRDEIYFHELLMHPFEKFKNTLPEGVTRDELKEFRDAYIRDCKGQSKAKSDCYGCVFCDKSYKKTATALSLLKIHLFTDHLDKVKDFFEQWKNARRESNNGTDSE